MFSMLRYRSTWGEPAGIFRREHLATLFGQQRRIAVDAERVGELHEPMVSLRLAVAESVAAVDPVGKSEQAARFQQPDRFGHQPPLVDHIAPGVFAPDEIRGGIGQTRIAGVGQREVDPLAQPFRFAAAASALDDGRRGIHPLHPRHVAEADEKAHPGAEQQQRSMPLMPAPMPAFSASSIDERKPPTWTCWPITSSHSSPSGPP